jgi:hypothetical protein
MADGTAPDTVTDALNLLSAAGYDASFDWVRGELRCSACTAGHVPSEAHAERVYRFEGPSDPADEAIVLGLRCPSCGAAGTFVSAFGPDADPDRFAELGPLVQQWRGRG